MKDGLQNTKLLKWILLVVLVGILGWQSTRLADPTALPLYDFIEYWAAGHLQLAGSNPYSPEKLFTLQQSLGWAEDIPVIMWNPPWTLSFVIPFGALNHNASRVLWLWLNLGLVLLCTDWCWHLYGGPTRYRWLAWVASLSFFPTILVLTLGQITPLVLGGVVGFLYFEKRRQWWLAGSTVMLIAIKPHLLYLFWPALLLWAVDRRCWSVLLGGGLAGLIATMIPLLFNPAMIGQYLYTMSHEPPFYWATPTFGMLLRLLIGLDKHWLQFVPPGLGMLWFLPYWRQHRHTWKWAEQMPLLLLVSVTTVSYGWTYDQVVLLPAVIQAGVEVFQSRSRTTIAWTAIIYLVISAVALAIAIAQLNDFWRIWMAPTLLLGYLVLRKQFKREALSLGHISALDHQSQTTENPIG